MSPRPTITPSRRGGWNKGGPETRQRILAVALGLFSQQGFHRTSIRRIAREAGLSDAALYYHFASKREILEALYEERGFVAAMQLLERLEARVPLRQQLVRTAMASADLWGQNGDLLRVVAMEVLQGDPAAAEIHLAMMRRWREGVALLLRRYQESGQLAATDSELAAERWVHLLFGTFLDRLMSARPEQETHALFAASDFRSYLQRSVEEFAAGLEAS